MPERPVTIWLHYIDASLPRKLGRKISKDQAVIKPTLDELVKACKELNLNFEVFKDAKYCRMWYSSSGKIVIYTGMRKLELLKLLASKIKSLRYVTPR